MELEKTTASWVSILISPNAQSPTFSPHNPGKSGMPPSPEANASPFPASLHDYTQPTPTPTHQQRRRQQLNSLPTTMSKKDTQQWTASGFEKAQRDFSSSAVRRFRRFVCVCVTLRREELFSDVYTFWMQGQQGIHSSAANEDSCGHSVKQIGTPICVPAKQLLFTLSTSPF